MTYKAERTLSIAKRWAYSEKEKELKESGGYGWNLLHTPGFVSTMLPSDSDCVREWREHIRRDFSRCKFVCVGMCTDQNNIVSTNTYTVLGRADSHSTISYDYITMRDYFKKHTVDDHAVARLDGSGKIISVKKDKEHAINYPALFGTTKTWISPSLCKELMEKFNKE